MPSNHKLYIPGGVHFVTFRTEEGLPFVAAEHVKLILEGILARATERYNVTLCHYLWMGNHVHMILVVHDPEALADFLCFLKTESAHAINRMLGNQRKTVWCAGSDAPVLLTPDSVMERIAYIYANPALADLVDNIGNYPMLSSWEMYSTKQHLKHCPVVCRDQIPTLGPKHLSLRHQQGFAASLREASRHGAKLRIAPNAWKRCFAGLGKESGRDIDDKILSRIRAKEAERRLVRKGPVLGALALQTQDMDVSYSPKKFSRKMICISSDKELRLDFIRWAKELFYQAKLAYAAWKAGNLSLKYPPGLFPPRAPRLANILSPL